MTQGKKEFWLVIISFFLIYFVWGSTYLANAWGIKSVPPFLYAGARFIIAGLSLLLFCRMFGPLNFTFNQVKNTAICGLFLFAVGNGLAVWALQFIDSGISALIVAFEPLLVVLLMWKFRNKVPDTHAWLGIGLGIIGMALLIGQPDYANNSNWLIGASAIFIAILAWAFISVWISTADLPESVFQSSALQMLFGGVFLLVMSFVNGDFSNFQWSEITPTAHWAFVYLVIFGSILTFSAFNFLLKTVSPTKVVTCTFVNPVIAMILGWWLNNEQLSQQSVFAAALLLFGVVFINGHMRDMQNLWNKRLAKR